MSAFFACPIPLATFIEPMLPLPAWNVKLGYGSFVTFEFGEPALEVNERLWPENALKRGLPVRGQWCAWIYCCHWSASQGDVQLAHSEDERERMRNAAAAFEGQKLLGISVSPGDGRSTFSFDLEGRLETEPYGDDPAQEQWILSSSAEAFVFRADGRYSVHSFEATPELQQWLSFS